MLRSKKDSQLVLLLLLFVLSTLLFTEFIFADNNVDIDDTDNVLATSYSQKEIDLLRSDVELLMERYGADPSSVSLVRKRLPTDKFVSQGIIKQVATTSSIIKIRKINSLQQ